MRCEVTRPEETENPHLKTENTLTNNKLDSLISH